MLAFEQYSSSGEDESVAAQLTDGVTSELARLGTLSVVSHTSATQFAGVRKPLREIAAALDADVVLEGSIQNHPDGIVVSAAAGERTRRTAKMWVENFPGQTSDIPGLNRPHRRRESALLFANAFPRANGRSAFGAGSGIRH